MNVDAFVRASISTWDPARPTASAMAIHHGRVVAFDDDAEALASGARRREEHDGYLFPGFHDAHCHTAAFGLSLSELDLSTPPVMNLAELYRAVEERARQAPRGEWVIGTGYDQNKIGGQHPDLHGLDEVAHGHPVWLRHTSAHMCVINSAAAALIELPRVVEGGRVVFDDEGAFTGLLEERAQSLVQRVVLPRSLDTIADAIGKAHERYRSEGITSVCDAGVAGGWIGQSPVEIAAYQLARERGLLKVRTTVMVASDVLGELHGHRDDKLEGALGLTGGIRTGLGDEWLRIGPVKVFADGSLLGRTCWMEEGFEDDPQNTGYPQADPDDLRRTIVGAHLAGWQVATHAIGDRAVRFVVDCYEEALARSPRRDHRHRIEHCGVTSEESLSRIAALGIVPVPQGRFVGEIGDGMRAALGPARTRSAYRLRSFLAAGAVLPASSDRPVVTGRPLLGMRDMVMRLTESAQPFGTEEAISTEEALRAYSLGSAFAEHTDTDRGALRLGQLADYVVLSEDPRRVAPPDLSSIEVLATSLSASTQ